MKLSVLVRALLVVLMTAFGVLGCTKSSSSSGSDGGSDDGGSSTSGGRMRFVNTLAEFPQVQLFIGTASTPILLNYGEFTNYMDFEEGPIEVRILNTTSPLPLLHKNYSVKASEDRTLVFYSDEKAPEPGKDYKMSAELVDDQHLPPVDQRFIVRIVNAAPSVKGFDVYVTLPGVVLGGNILPRKKGVGFRNDSGYLEGNEASAIVTLIDSKTRNVLYTSPVTNFAAHPVVTFYVLDTLGRGLPVVVKTSFDSDL